MMRRPSLTSRVALDLLCVASFAERALDGQAATALTPRQKAAVRRGLAYIEAVARWHHAQKPERAEAPAP